LKLKEKVKYQLGIERVDKMTLFNKNKTFENSPTR